MSLNIETPPPPSPSKGDTNIPTASELASTVTCQSSPALSTQPVLDSANENQINDTSEQLQKATNKTKVTAHSSHQIDESEWTDDEKDCKKEEKTSTKKTKMTTAKSCQRTHYSKQLNIKPISLKDIKTSITDINKCINKKQRSFDRFKATCNKVLNHVISKIEQSRVHTRNALKEEYNERL